MIEFIVKYWLEFLLGSLAAIIVGVFKYAWKGIKIHISNTISEECERITTKLMESKGEEDETQNSNIAQLTSNIAALTHTVQQLEASVSKIESKFDQIDERMKAVENSQKDFSSELGEDFSDLKEGVLSIQQKGFKTMCGKLLQQSDPITYDQYDSLVNEHRIYNNLGGNHDGDELFRLVTIKYQNGLK